MALRYLFLLMVCALSGSSVKGIARSRVIISPIIYLTVSPLARCDLPNRIPPRIIRVHWMDVPEPLLNNSSVWIGLYSKDPRLGAQYPKEVIRLGKSSTGYINTTFVFPQQHFSSDNLTSNCLDFWITLASSRTIKNTSCIKSSPNWMYDMRNIIENVSLHDIMIPGTHNSGCYTPFKCRSVFSLDRVTMTQEEDIFSQLVYGIRYLDLRVVYEVGGVLKVTHSIVRTRWILNDVLQQVKRFLDATKEIVILDFHRVFNHIEQELTQNQSNVIIGLLERELKDYMLPTVNGTRLPLKDIWRMDKRLIVCYSGPNYPPSQYLFPAVTHLWGKVNTPERLFNYFDSELCEWNDNLTAAMAALTMQSQDVFTSSKSLRSMSDEVNLKTTEWFLKRWPCANIVATDYFLGSNIVNVALEVNRRKFLKPK